MATYGRGVTLFRRTESFLVQWVFAVLASLTAEGARGDAKRSPTVSRADVPFCAKLARIRSCRRGEPALLIYPFKLAIGAGILLAVLYKLARHEADFSFGKAFMIIGALSICGFAVSLMLGTIVAFIATFALGVWLIAKFLYVPQNKAIAAMAAYTGVQILLAWLF